MSEKVAVELFSGTESFSKVWREKGLESCTVDIEEQYNPDLVKDIRELEVEDLPERFRNPYVVWASPPCNKFSIASCYRHWENGNPKRGARDGIELLSNALRLIMQLNPNYFFIENPRGMMRSIPIMSGLNKETVTYCQYGGAFMKPTDIWTNSDAWYSRETCSNGDDCHVQTTRSGNEGIQSLSGDGLDRAVIPRELIDEIIGVVLHGSNSKQEKLIGESR